MPTERERSSGCSELPVLETDGWRKGFCWEQASDQRAVLHGDRHHAGRIQRRERGGLARYLAAARRSLAGWFGAYRFRDSAQSGGAEKLPASCHRAFAARAQNRDGQVALAGGGTTSYGYSTIRR